MQEAHRRHYRGHLDSILRWFLVVGVFIHVLQVLGVFGRLGCEFSFLRWMVFSLDAFRGVHLFFVVPAVFLFVPATKNAPRDRLPWYDLLAIVLCMVPAAYRFIAWNTYELNIVYGSINTFELVSAFILMLVIAEASRRTFGPVMPIIALSLFVYPFVSEYLPGFLAAKSSTFEHVICYTVLGMNGIYGRFVGLCAYLVLPYMLFGLLLTYSGGGQFFINLALALFGRSRAGPALAAAVSSGMFGSLSGMTSANVVVTGTFTIPLMKRTGLSPNFAAAVEAAASNGGMIMPPVMGTVAFVMADILGIPYWSVCVAAFLPAVLYFLCIAVMVWLEAGKRNLRPLPPEEIPSLKKTLISGGPFILPLVVLIYFMGVAGYSPQLACILAIATLILVSMLRKETRLSWQKIKAAMADTIPIVAPVTCLLALAGIMMGNLGMTGLSLRLSSGLISIAGDNVPFLLLVTAIACVIIGMPLNISTAYIILAAIIAPSLAILGVNLLAVHMFIMYYATLGPITPPTCPAAFVAALVAGKKDTNPYLIGFLAMRVVAVALVVPFTFIYDPVLLLMGRPTDIILGLFTAILALLAMGIGLQGWFLGRANWLQRILFLGAALMLIWPGWQTDVIGFAVGTMAVVYHLITTRGVKAKTSDYTF